VSLHGDVNQTQFPKYVYLFLNKNSIKVKVVKVKAVPLCSKQSQRGGSDISLSRLNPGVRRE
jgi:hypothetical protein